MTGAAGASFSDARAATFGVEIGETLHPRVQAYAAFNYFDNLFNDQASSDLADLATYLTRITGDTWAFSGRDRGLAFSGGAWYPVPGTDVPAVCGRGSRSAQSAAHNHRADARRRERPRAGGVRRRTASSMPGKKARSGQWRSSSPASVSPRAGPTWTWATASEGVPRRVVHVLAVHRRRRNEILNVQSFARSRAAVRRASSSCIRDSIGLSPSTRAPLLPSRAPPGHQPPTHPAQQLNADRGNQA